MNKQGKTNIWMVLGVICVLAVLCLAVYGTFYMKQSGGGIDLNLPDSPEGCADSTATLTVNGINALNKGSSITTNLTAGLVGSSVATSVTSGTTTFPVGTRINIISALEGYIDDSVEDVLMQCGGTVIDIPLYQSTSDNPAIRIKNDDGDYMSDLIAGGAINQTNVAAGETLTLEVEFKGTSLESSGDGIWIVETPAGSAANVTKIELDGVAGKALPTVHTTINAGSKAVSFEIPAIAGANTEKKTLTIVLGASADLSGGIYTDWYAKQDFIDDDGTIKNGIEDSDGTAKYENTLDFDFYIDAA